MIAVGACGSREFTVLGNVVNVAFRLNSVGSECDKDLLTGRLQRDTWKVILPNLNYSQKN